VGAGNEPLSGAPVAAVITGECPNAGEATIRPAARDVAAGWLVGLVELPRLGALGWGVPLAVCTIVVSSAAATVFEELGRPGFVAADATPNRTSRVLLFPLLEPLRTASVGSPIVSQRTPTSGSATASGKSLERGLRTPRTVGSRFGISIYERRIALLQAAVVT
jgi:hypothetical protein